jgi:DNA adenine methylase
MNSLTPADPASPAASYIGGKRRLAARIIEQLAAIPHTTYVEPFVGMGGVFLRRPFRAKAEVINDLNMDVANLFRCLQRHYQALLDMLRWQITSREHFERLLAAVPDTLTDLERAARFLYLQRVAWGGKVTHQIFGVSATHPGRFDVTRLVSILEGVHERLAGVVIERLPYAELLARYDRPATLFYLEPPYYGSERDYGPGFDRAEFDRLAASLAALQGQFILSLNDHPEVRRIFRGFAIQAVATSYSINPKVAGKVGDVLISNRPRKRR